MTTTLTRPARRVRRPSTGWRRDPVAHMVRLGSVAVLLTAWEIGGRASNPVLFSPPSAVLRGLGELTAGGVLLPAVGASALDLLFGFLPAVLVGVPIGLAAGRIPAIGDMASPYFAILLTLPMIALTPLVLFAFGIGQTARAALIFAFCLAQIMVNAAAGASSVPRLQLDMSRAFGVRGARALRLVVLPSASPAVFAGLRLGLGQGIIGVIVAELTVSPVGLGGLITHYAARYRADYVLGAVVTIGVTSMLVFRLMAVLERRACGWAQSDGGR